MNKLTKDLLKIFRPEGEFRQGDVVKYYDGKKGIIVYKSREKLIEGRYAVLENNGVETFIYKENLTLIEPMVTLSEVLKGFIDQNKDGWDITMDIENLMAQWILFDENKELGLFQQAKSKQELIYRILK